MALTYQQKNFRLPDDLANALKQAAEQTGRSETEVLNEALRGYLFPEIPTLSVVNKKLDRLLERTNKSK